MKTYQYWDYAENGETLDGDNILVTMDEVDILEEYWDRWCERLSKYYPDFRKDEMDFRSKSECIDDWMIVNWAWEKK